MTFSNNAPIDEVIAKARTKSLEIIQASERKFVESVVARGAMSEADALRVLGQQRGGVLDDLDEAMKDLRAWILRGCKDHH